jgi:hypothetical protein
MSEHQVTSIELSVLNAAADDFENLEYLFESISLEFSPEEYQANGFYWRTGAMAPPLSEIADAVESLVKQGLLIVKLEDGRDPPTNELSYVWRGWFVLSPTGRDLLTRINSK